MEDVWRRRKASQGNSSVIGSIISSRGDMEELIAGINYLGLVADRFVHEISMFIINL